MEADSQLSYLNIKNLVDLIITDDSDICIFGSGRIIYKLNLDDGKFLLYDENIIREKIIELKNLKILDKEMKLKPFEIF